MYYSLRYSGMKQKTAWVLKDTGASAFGRLP